MARFLLAAFALHGALAKPFRRGLVGDSMRFNHAYDDESLNREFMDGFASGRHGKTAAKSVPKTNSYSRVKKLGETTARRGIAKAKSTIVVPVQKKIYSPVRKTVTKNYNAANKKIRHLSKKITDPINKRVPKSVRVQGARARSGADKACKVVKNGICVAVRTPSKVGKAIRKGIKPVNKKVPGKVRGTVQGAYYHPGRQIQTIKAKSAGIFNKITKPIGKVVPKPLRDAGVNVDRSFGAAGTDIHHVAKQSGKAVAKIPPTIERMVCKSCGKKAAAKKGPGGV